MGDVARRQGVKILSDTKRGPHAKLGEKELTIPLVVKLPVSAGARKKIEKAGGAVET